MTPQQAGVSALTEEQKHLAVSALRHYRTACSQSGTAFADNIDSTIMALLATAPPEQAALRDARPANEFPADKSEAAIAIGLCIYARMVRLAHDGNQTVGEKRNYYVTLEQLEAAFVNMRDELRTTAGGKL